MNLNELSTIKHNAYIEPKNDNNISNTLLSYNLSDIFKYLCVQDLAAVSLVDKKWKNLKENLVNLDKDTQQLFINHFASTKLKREKLEQYGFKALIPQIIELRARQNPYNFCINSNNTLSNSIEVIEEIQKKKNIHVSIDDIIVGIDIYCEPDFRYSYIFFSAIKDKSPTDLIRVRCPRATHLNDEIAYLKPTTENFKQAIDIIKNSNHHRPIEQTNEKIWETYLVNKMMVE